MPHLKFHLGAHKCASTAIQKVLAQAPADPSRRYIGPKAIEGDHPLSSLRDLGRLPMSATQVEAEVQKTLAFAEAESTPVLVSSENILGPMLGLHPSIYPLAAQVAEYLHGLRRHADVEAFLLLREPASFVGSCYVFRARRGFSASATAFVDALEFDGLSWAPAVRILHDVLGPRLHLRPFELLRSEFDAMRPWLTALDGSLRELDALPRSNVSARGLPLFIVQQLRIAGVDISSLMARKLIVAMREAYAAANIPLDLDPPHPVELIRVAHRVIEEVKAPKMKVWRPSVRLAVRQYLTEREFGRDPHTLGAAMSTAIAQRHAEAHRALFRDLMPDVDPAVWGLTT